MPKKILLDHKSAIYKNKPLVRCNDIIYYGNINDKYVIKMKILNTISNFNIDVADKVSISLINTDSLISKKEEVIKKCEKNGLYAAFDIADVWLCKALAESST